MSEFSLSDSYRPVHVKHLPMLKSSRMPPVTLALGFVTLIAIVAVTLFLVFVPWIQTVSGTGQIVALNPADREQPISALVPGRIAEWYVREGSVVQQGDPIARIVDNDPNLVTRLQQQINIARDRLTLARTAAATAKLDLDRKKTLFEDGIEARREYEQAGIRVAQLEANVQSAVRDLNEAEVAIAQQGSQIVEAPRAGIITRVTSIGTASFVKAGDPLARIAPSGVELAVELYVDPLDASLLSPGRPVRLEFEGWPAIQFSGWPEVAIGTFAAKVAFIEPLASAGGRFRVIIKEDPDATGIGAAWPDGQFLRLGTASRGWIMLDEVKVGYELWRRMNNFPPEFTRDVRTGAQNAGTGGAN